MRRLEEGFDLREWRGEGHLITVEAERRLQAQVRSMLRRLAVDGSALVLRDQVCRNAASYPRPLCSTLALLLFGPPPPDFGNIVWCCDTWGRAAKKSISAAPALSAGRRVGALHKRIWQCEQRDFGVPHLKNRDAVC